MPNPIRWLFGSHNDRVIKPILPLVDRINRLEVECAKLGDAALRGKTAEFRERLEPRRAARRSAARGVRAGARGGQAHARPAPLRRAADRRRDPAPRQHRRDEDGRGQDAGRHAAGLSERAHRARRAHRHRERLPGAARRRVDGRGPPLPRALGRRDRARSDGSAAPRGLRLRHHLRHQQRARLRLPARQHEVLARELRPARAALRDRRRGRLDPDRRGAHAADHLRTLGAEHAALRGREPRDPEAQRRHEGRAQPGHRGDGRLLDRREGAQRRAHGGGRAQRREAARRREPLRPADAARAARA